MILYKKSFLFLWNKVWSLNFEFHAPLSSHVPTVVIVYFEQLISLPFLRAELHIFYMFFTQEMM